MNIKSSTKKTKFMSRLTSTVLAAGLIMSIVPTTAFAADPVVPPAVEDVDSTIAFEYVATSTFTNPNEFPIPSDAAPTTSAAITMTGNEKDIIVKDSGKAKITYSLVEKTPPLTGVTITEATGALSITKAAEIGTFDVRADYTLAAIEATAKVTGDAVLATTDAVTIKDDDGILPDATLKVKYSTGSGEGATAGSAVEAVDLGTGWTFSSTDSASVAAPVFTYTDADKGTATVTLTQVASDKKNGVATVQVTGYEKAIPSYQTVPVELVAAPAAKLVVGSDASTVKKALFKSNGATFTLSTAAIDDAEFAVYPAVLDGDGNPGNSPVMDKTASTTIKATIDADRKKGLTIAMKDSTAALPAGTYWVTQWSDIASESEPVAFTVANPESKVKSVAFTYETKEIAGTAVTMEYSVDGGTNFIKCAVTNTVLSAESMAALTVANGIIVRVIEDPLDKTTIKLTKQVEPSAKSTAPTTAAGKGSITIASPTGQKFDYKLKTDAEWTTTVNAAIAGVAPGVYQLRTAGKTTALPSDIIEITVLAYGVNPTQIGIKVFEANKMGNKLFINGKTTFDVAGMTVVKTFNDGNVSPQPVLITEPTAKITTSIKNGAVLTSNDKTVKITWGDFSVEHKFNLSYIDIGTQMGAVRAGSDGAVKFAVTSYKENTLAPKTKVEAVFVDKDGKETAHEGITTDNAASEFDENGNCIIKFDIAKTAKAGSYSFGVVTGADDAKIYTAGKLTVSATGATTPPVTPSTGGSGGNNNYYYGGSGSTGTTPKVPDNTAASAGATVKADGAVISGAGVPAGAKLTVVSALSPSAGEAFPSFVTGKANAATVSALNGFATRGALKGVFNISLDKALTGAVTVTIPTTNLIPDQSVTVIHVKDDGTSEYLVGTANKNGNLIVPGVKSLSPFIVLNAIYQPTASGTTGGGTTPGTPGGTTGGDTTSTVPKTGVELLAPLF